MKTKRFTSQYQFIVAVFIATLFFYTSLAQANEMNTSIYGFIEGFGEKVIDQPAIGGGNQSNPHEFNVPHLNVMVQSEIKNFKGFLNINGADAGNLDVANAWVEWAIYKDYIKMRIGKLYRPFGLYNEILDAVPTYIGIEPPELFDGDHQMVTRTTNFMLFGEVNFGYEHNLRYSLTTGNDERLSDQVPLGLDLRYTRSDWLTIGTSAYTSMGKATGGNSGGVLNWMDSDEFYVLGLYSEIKRWNWILQGAFWFSQHDAIRNQATVFGFSDGDADDITLNTRQRQRFGLDTATAATGVTQAVKYKVYTAYTRVGRNFNLPKGMQITPYFQYDFYSNPEIVQAKSVGGDNEAGLADDGRFHKVTAGLVYRPVSFFAAKLDGSYHFQKVGGSWSPYPEIRGSFSYFWKFK